MGSRRKGTRFCKDRQFFNLGQFENIVDPRSENEGESGEQSDTHSESDSSGDENEEISQESQRKESEEELPELSEVTDERNGSMNDASSNTDV